MVKRLVGRAVARVVKSAAEAAGLDPSEVSAHSLRSGFCTEAARNGASERSIMETTGHKDPKIVRQYITRASVFDENATEAIGL